MSTGTAMTVHPVATLLSHSFQWQDGREVRTVGDLLGGPNTATGDASDTGDSSLATKYSAGLVALLDPLDPRTLDDATLQRAGVSAVFHRKRILRWIGQLQPSATATPACTTASSAQTTHAPKSGSGTAGAATRGQHGDNSTPKSGATPLPLPYKEHAPPRMSFAGRGRVQINCT